MPRVGDGTGQGGSAPEAEGLPWNGSPEQPNSPGGRPYGQGEKGIGPEVSGGEERNRNTPLRGTK